jgi:DNA mismatch endonuclease, patch repair protein
MTDTVSAARRSENMRRIRSKSTAPEVFIRSLVHRLGFRFRLHRKDLPGKPDLVFPGRRKIIFVHGCFWHLHGGSCKVARIPRSNAEYWIPKLRRNKERDAEHVRLLKEMGWTPLVIWECETTDSKLAAHIATFLGS